MLSKNQIIPLEITDITSEGNGVGRYEGMAVFVPMTAIGDEIDAKIVKVQKNFCFGIVEEIKTPSKDRIEPDCPVFKSCGGCDFRHMTYSAEKEHKRNRVEQVMQRIGKTSLKSEATISQECSDYYRNKAIYPIKKVNGKVAMGFYAKRSHNLIEHYDCKLHPEFFAVIAHTVRDFLEEYKVPIYDEVSHRGMVRSLFIRHAEATGQVMVCLVVNGQDIPNSDVLIKRLTALNVGITSIFLNTNREKSNVLMGKYCKVLYGNEYIEDILCGLKFRISPLSFYQVNRKGAELLYTCAKEMADLKGGEMLLDLYCGAGTIGLSMCDKASSLIGVEIIPEAIENAKENAELNGITKARFICADASEAAATLKSEGLTPDVIVLDPPRKGCEASVIETITSMSPSRIVMISCDPATAARDIAIFAGHGYAASKLQVVDMFSRTGHVEAIILMTYCGDKVKNEG